MAYECAGCGKPANQHRLTRAGNLYCLKYNWEYSLNARSDSQSGIDRTYTCPVRELDRSSITRRIGEVIATNLHTYIGASV
jgi:hypothetical protein